MTEKLAVHPSEFWSAIETVEKIFKRKTCIAGNRGNCDGQIIEAHTIPKSQLRKIAVDGHVYGIQGNAGDLYRNGGEYSARKRGIGQFSVLNFFCAEHDREIFSHLENDELVFDDHQLTLLHYRAMGAELYKKMNAVSNSRFMIERLRGRQDRDIADKLRFAKDMGAGNMLGLRDMSKTFGKCESILVNKEYTRVKALVVRFKRMPSIMTVGGFSPEFDYDERSLQQLGKIESEYHQLGFSILAHQGRGAVIFTWLDEARVCEQFVRSFLAQDRVFYTTLAIQTAFEHLENTCMNIQWWDTLRPIERTMLLRRMQFAGSLAEERLASCLGYCGITFDQWEFDNFKAFGMGGLTSD